MTTTQSEETTGRRSALYTPEAVKVDLPLADVGSRTLAILIDLFVMTALLYLVLILAVAGAGIASAGFEEGPGWLAIVAILLLNFLVLWGYPTGSETLLNGRTAGKAALGLRVVTTDGAPVRFRHAAIRGLFAFIDFYLFLGIPALVSALVTRRGQRLGDLAAGTVTIRDRSSGQADQAVFWQVPPGLRSYASTLDVRGLSAADYAVLRRFLLRASSLRPEHRSRVATDLANLIADRLNHRPPSGTHPEALLLCTAALLQGGVAQAPPPRGATPVSAAPPAGGSWSSASPPPGAVPPVSSAPSTGAPGPSVSPPPGAGPGGPAVLPPPGAGSRQWPGPVPVPGPAPGSGPGGVWGAGPGSGPVPVPGPAPGSGSDPGPGGGPVEGSGAGRDGSTGPSEAEPAQAPPPSGPFAPPS